VALPPAATATYSTRLPFFFPSHADWWLYLGLGRRKSPRSSSHVRSSQPSSETTTCNWSPCHLDFHGAKTKQADEIHNTFRPSWLAWHPSYLVSSLHGRDDRVFNFRFPIYFPLGPSFSLTPYLTHLSLPSPPLFQAHARHPLLRSTHFSNGLLWNKQSAPPSVQLHG
jgi:hypothetical protein